MKVTGRSSVFYSLQVVSYVEFSCLSNIFRVSTRILCEGRPEKKLNSKVSETNASETGQRHVE